MISSLTGIPESDFAKLQVSYGATILSFLGGVHWGTCSSIPRVAPPAWLCRRRPSLPAGINAHVTRPYVLCCAVGLAMTTLTPLKFTAERYIWSVCPCLAAFPTMILPVQQAAAIQAALIGLVYMTDRSWAKRGGLPLWYMKTLRGPLSLVAGTSLVLTAISTTGGTGASGEE